MLLVPNPEPAGMADNRVISIPQPKALSCLRKDGNFSSPNPGIKPANANAALGMENGDPTLLNNLNSSYVSIRSIAPKSMERQITTGSLQGFT